MNTDNLGLEILQILSPVFLAALTWAAGRLSQLIRAKVQNENLKGVLLRLDDAVLTTVKDLEVTVVDQLKAASAGGKLTEDAKKQLKATAVATVVSHLGTTGLAEVAKVFGLEGAAFEKLLSSKIEAAVHDLYGTTPPPSTDAPAAETARPSQHDGATEVRFASTDAPAAETARPSQAA